MYFVDTNILLNNLSWIDKQDYIIISSITLEELEHIKTNRNKTDDLRYEARKSVNWLKNNVDKYHVVIYDNAVSEYCNNAQIEINNDIKILCCAKYYYENNNTKDITFITNDILCELIAKNYFKLNVEIIEDNDEIYKGYKKLKGNTSEINYIMSNIELSDWNVNEYIIIENLDDNTIKEMRFDGEKFVNLKLPPSKYIKGKNSLQRCALDALNNPEIDICAILGTYGSGKTFMSFQLALYSVREKGWQSKVLGVREIVGEGREPGYLPGDIESKVGSFFEPLTQSLAGGVFELDSLKQSGILETQIPHFMKGTTYNDTVIICDEAEDLSEAQIRLIGTRLGIGSRIFFSGDYKQSLFNKGKNNALLKMCNSFKGNSRFACVCLEEDVRSEASKMFAELYK